MTSHKPAGTHLELLLHLRQLLHLLAQFERGRDGVGTRQRHEGGAGERAVGVEARPRPLQRVVVLLDDAVVALARNRVRPLDDLVAREEDLDDLVVVVVRGEDQRRDVGRELALLLRPEERVADALPLHLLLAGDIVRMLDHQLHDLDAALADHVQQRLLDTLEVQLVEQQLDRLDAFVVDRQVERVAAHVVDAVDVQHNLVLLERLANDGDIAERRRVQVHALLVRQLKRHGAYVMWRTSWGVRHGAYVTGPTSWGVHHGTYAMGRTSKGVRHGAYVAGGYAMGRTSGGIRQGEYIMGHTSWGIRHGAYVRGNTSWGIRHMAYAMIPLATLATLPFIRHIPTLPTPTSTPPAQPQVKIMVTPLQPEGRNPKVDCVNTNQYLPGRNKAALIWQH